MMSHKAQRLCYTLTVLLRLPNGLSDLGPKSKAPPTKYHRSPRHFQGPNKLASSIPTKSTSTKASSRPKLDRLQLSIAKPTQTWQNQHPSRTRPILISGCTPHSQPAPRTSSQRPRDSRRFSKPTGSPSKPSMWLRTRKRGCSGVDGRQGRSYRV
jgi:hypothetical protein